MADYQTKRHQGVAYWDIGDKAARPVILLPGYGCNKEVWRHQVPQFAERYRVIAPDLPGHGESDAVPHLCTIEGYGTVVNDLRRHLGLERPILLGHSMGGRVSLETQRQAPEAYAGVILLDVSRAVSPDHDEDVRQRLSTGEDHRAFRAHMRRLFEENFSLDCPDAIREEIRASSKQLDRKCARVLTPTISKWDHDHWEEALTKIQCPVFVLQSTYLIFGQSRRILDVGEEIPFFDMIREHVPDVHIDWLKTGHFSMLEEPDAVTAHLLRFLDTLS